MKSRISGSDILAGASMYQECNLTGFTYLRGFFAAFCIRKFLLLSRLLVCFFLNVFGVVLSQNIFIESGSD